MCGGGVWCWLLLALAGSLSAQFLDFSSFFPAANNVRQTISRQGHVTRGTTVRPEHSYDGQYQKKVTRRPIAQTTKRSTQTRRKTTEKLETLSFSSFIDVPNKDGTRQSFQTSDAQQSRKSTLGSSSSQHKIPQNGHTSRPDRTTSTVSPHRENQEFQNSSNSRQSSNESPELHKWPSSRDYQTTITPSSSRGNSRYTTSKVTTENPYNRPNDYNDYSANSYESSTRRQIMNNGNQNPIYGYDYTSKRTTNHRDYTTTRPEIFGFDNTYDSDRRSDVAHDRRNASRPGTLGVLQPNIDENRAPITNAPPSASASLGGGDFVFRERQEPPELITGPDERFLSDEKKRRALQTADRMCSRYQAQNTQQLSAIPLVPSPSPATVSVRRCTPVNVPLVVGGQVVTIDQYPHMAAVGWANVRGGGYSWKCGGSLVSERFVLTAAHCSYQDRDNTIAQGPPGVVQLGATRLDDSTATVAAVAAAIRHPNYKAPAAYYDVALLKLRAAVSLSDKIRPACIGEPPREGESVIATGWGQTEFGGSTSAELRGVSLPVWELSTCARSLGTSRKLPRGPDASQLCAGELRGGKDTCQGDSGGPAQVGSSCEWRVVGVTSLGRACGAPRTPALYALAQRLFIAAVVWL